MCFWALKATHACHVMLVAVGFVFVVLCWIWDYKYAFPVCLCIRVSISTRLTFTSVIEHHRLTYIDRCTHAPDVFVLVVIWWVCLCLDLCDICLAVLESVCMHMTDAIHQHSSGCVVMKTVKPGLSVSGCSLCSELHRQRYCEEGLVHRSDIKGLCLNPNKLSRSFIWYVSCLHTQLFLNCLPKRHF